MKGKELANIEGLESRGPEELVLDPSIVAFVAPMGPSSQ